MVATQNPATGANGTGNGGTGGNGSQDAPATTGDRHKKKAKTKPSKGGGKDFKGDTEDMNGHVFQTFGEANDRMQFNKTLEALGHYINKSLKHPGDLVRLYKRIERPTIPTPDDITNAEFADERRAWNWKEDMRRHKDRQIVLENNLRLLYAVIWGQCSEPMKAKLEGLPQFEERDIDCDCVWLLQSIRSTMYQFEGKKHLFVAMAEARTKLEKCCQRPGQDLTEYFHEFKQTVDAFEHYGGTLGMDLGLINSLISDEDDDYPGFPPVYDETNPEQSYAQLNAYNQNLSAYRARLEVLSRDKTLAIMFLQRVDQNKYAHLSRELHNEYTRGYDSYPNSLAAAYTLVDTFVPPKNPNNNRGNRGNSKKKTEEPDLGPEATTPGFLQIDTDAMPEDPVPDFANMTLDSNTDTLATDDPEFVQGYIFNQVHTDACNIPESWILLDSQSTISVFRNKAYLTNIRESRSPLILASNGGGRVRLTQVGDLKNFGTIWYNPQSLANILSLADVRRQNRVTMDTAVEPALIIHRKDGSEMKFLEYKTGLYYYDVATSNPPSNEPVSPYCLVQTVADKKAVYHRREIEGADKARELYVRLGRPSQKHFEFL